jgi:hypothetical protein
LFDLSFGILLSDKETFSSGFTLQPPKKLTFLLSRKYELVTKYNQKANQLLAPE